LPDIPDVDIWVGFWGTRKAAYDVASLAFDNSGPAYTTEKIEKHGGGGLRFLYPVFVFFCEEEEMTNTCTLKDDYKDQWKAAVPMLTQLLKEGKIIGFTVGDERVCGDGHHGTPVKDLVKMIDHVRESFPDRSKAIIHYNECWKTFGYEDDNCKHAAMDDVPEGLDWINIDHYRKSDTDDDFMDKLKKYHEECIYPKMHKHQKICITPGTTSEVCPNEKTCLKDAKYAVNWAESDDKVGCITVYRWDDMDDLDDGEWSDLKDYWIDYASKSRPETQKTTVV
jgi:hypothetical protein